MLQKLNQTKPMPAQKLNDVKIEQLNKQPIFESFAMLNEDKKWLVHKTTITDIKPVNYYEKVLGIVEE